METIEEIGVGACRYKYCHGKGIDVAMAIGGCSDKQFELK